MERRDHNEWLNHAMDANQANEEDAGKTQWLSIFRLLLRNSFFPNNQSSYGSRFRLEIRLGLSSLSRLWLPPFLYIVRKKKGPMTLLCANLTLYLYIQWKSLDFTYSCQRRICIEGLFTYESLIGPRFMWLEQESLFRQELLSLYSRSFCSMAQLRLEESLDLRGNTRYESERYR